MLIRLVEEHRRRGVKYAPGALLEVRADEAMVLIQDGLAVPVLEASGRETRTQ